jgi:PEGA domain
VVRRSARLGGAGEKPRRLRDKRNGVAILSGLCAGLVLSFACVPRLAAAQVSHAARSPDTVIAQRAWGWLTTAVQSTSPALIGGATIVGQISGLHDQTQRVVLLAPNVDSYSVSEVVRALATLGVSAVSVRDARLDPALEACGTFGCLSQIARASQGRAALVNLSRSGDGSNSLLLVLVDADGGNAQARARVGAAGIAEALTAAWKETSLSLALAGDSMIHAESRPAGASVWLDGAPAGSTPFARQVGPGKHSVLLKLDGFVAEERTVIAKPGRAERIQLTLRREPRFDKDELTRTSEPLPSAWNSIIGGALIIGAAPALIASLNALANDGECLPLRQADAKRCSDRAHFGGQSIALLTGGILAFATGTTFLVAQPIE